MMIVSGGRVCGSKDDSCVSRLTVPCTRIVQCMLLIDPWSRCCEA